MDIERFAIYARDPSRTRTELERMLTNVSAKGAIEHAQIVEEVLSQRFPTHAKARSGGGKTATTATFRSESRHFESGKDAYLWLVSRMYSHCPTVLDDYLRLHAQARARLRGTRFAKNHLDLFPIGSSRRGNHDMFASVAPGWYADVNFNHAAKFDTLIQLSYLANLTYAEDWDFQVLGATAQLAKHQDLVRRSKKLLEELLR